MNLLYIEGGVVKPTPEALQIKVFKDIWDRDKSTKKEQALGEFAFIKFLHHPGKDNPYYNYPEEVRPFKIMERLAVKVNDDDELIILASAYYSQLIDEASTTKRFYDACVKGADKLIMFLETVNFNERDKKEAAVYKPNDINMVLKSAFETLQSLSSMKEKVEQEMFESTKTRGNRTINKYEKKKEDR